MRYLARLFGWLYLLNRSKDDSITGVVAQAAIANRLAERTEDE